MQIAGYLIFLSPREGRFYQLIGICLHRLGQYESADQYYELSLVFDADNPMTLIYRGEAQIMAGQRPSGLDFVRRGARLAGQDPPANQEMLERAKVLLQQFGS